MNILALSDIHGSYKEMLEIVSSHSSVDVIIIAGDLTTYGSQKEAQDVIKQLQVFGKPVLVVAGNMDPPELDDLFVQLNVSINSRGVVIDGVGFFGVSASPLSPLNTPNEITEEEITRRATAGWRDVVNANRKVFVPHAPPINTTLDVIRSGKHVGSRALRAFIERHQPDVAICGHIHEARGTDVIGNTQIINCGPVGNGYYGLISIGKEIVVESKGWRFLSESC